VYRFRRAGYSTDYLVVFWLSSMFFIIFWDRFRLEGNGVQVQAGGLFYRLSGGFLVVLYVLYYLLGQISTGRRRCTGSGGRIILPIIWWIFGCPLCFILSFATDFDWKETVYRFRRAGYSTDYLVDFSIVTDSKNSSWRVIDIDQVLQNKTNNLHM
jgi:hypothetical protein